MARALDSLRPSEDGASVAAGACFARVRRPVQVLASKADGAGRVWAATKPIQVLDEVPLTAGRELVSSFAAEPGMAYIVVPYTG